MTQAAEMLDTFPADLGRVNRAALVHCIEECFSCSQVCTACADACLSERDPAGLVRCIRGNLDCADLCDTTGRLLSRHTGFDIDTVRHTLEACAAACKSCADECERHEHEHCRVCAQACRRCERACRELITVLG
ncbi:four-helix bundle copper-binding protein [Amycolatopsis sp. WAC 01376]|uniref:four-helix bundle copper-binding protein n=1 Tax=Amycolatopsis sp. WAC 01376 TaxID=2203195 RepID=UPI000F780068|nr:four-helix bundle copper-binding protein [Amycolatopsis sp. WAC 01376]RSM52287.1 four-helix bundle copper-binding protein [Amycolatopsis sp. WAC 01376]